MKKDNEHIDIPKLNEVIKVGRNILKLGWALMIIGLILLSTFVIKEWNVFGILKTFLTVISPFFIGLVIAWLLDPMVTWFQKNGIKRAFATIIVFLTFIGVIILFFALMIPALVNQVNDFISYAPRILDYIKDTSDNLFSRLSLIYDYDFTNVKDSIYLTLSNLISSVTVDIPNKIVTVASAIISGGLNIILGLFVGFYMLFDFNNIRKHIINLLPKRIHSDAITISDNLNKTLKSYVQGTLIIMLILFIFQSVALKIAGLSSPMLFGLFCAVTNVIPYFGPYIGGIPAVLVGFTISPVVGFGALIAVVVAQLLESYFLNPLVMSKSMKLHPVTIMLGLLIFGHFFGIIGMVLATPAIACLKILFNFFNEKYELIHFINK